MKRTWQSADGQGLPKIRERKVRLKQDGLQKEHAYWLQGNATRRDKMVTGTRIHTPREPFRYRPRNLREAALSYMQRGPYDLRPQLLMMWFGYVTADAASCATYGANYLRAWCHRVELPNIARAAAAAATDALLLIYMGFWRGKKKQPIARPTIKARVKELKVSRSDFLLLRTKAHSVYRERLYEAQLSLMSTLYGAADLPAYQYVQGLEVSTADSKEQASQFAGTALRASPEFLKCSANVICAH